MESSSSEVSAAGSIPVVPFRWRDGERLIVFGRDRLAEAADLIEQPYTVLTTRRAEATAPALLERASAVHDVPAGRVDEVAGELRGDVAGEWLVALGGGRVIDVAKALAAADPPRRVVAIPTTLSGAEMTPVHRHAAGVEPSTRGVRPSLVINDPALAASQPAAELAQSAGNALGHAIEGPTTPLGNPVATLAALHAAHLIARGFASLPPGEDERDALALGALLAGYAISSTGYGLHHVLSQTLARFGGVGHGAANAIMLPESVRALRDRAPGWYYAALEQALDFEPEQFASRLRALTGVPSLREAGVSEESLERCVEEASRRPELQMTPPPAGAEEIRGLYAAAY
jgi:alcohol dehydrogenase class IV